VTASTESNQVHFTVGSTLGARPDVVYFKLFQATAELTTPAVAFKHLLAQLRVELGI
jgi:hypothetical protein